MAKKSAKAAMETKVEEATALVPQEQAALPAVVTPMDTNIGLEDMKRPLLKIVQAISPEVEDLGVAPGQFFVNVLNMELGGEVEATVLGTRKEFILWNPQRGVEPMVLARSTDCVTWDEGGANQEFTVNIQNVGKVKWKTGRSVADSGLANFGSSVPGNRDSKPALAKTFNFLLYLHGHDILPVGLSLSRGLIKAAESLNTICFGNSNVDPRSLKVKLRIVQKKEDGKDFFAMVPMRGGKLDEATYRQMVHLGEKFQSFRLDPNTDDNRAAPPVDESKVEY